MRQSDQMFRDPFRGMGMGMLEDGRGHGRENRARGNREQRNELAPFEDFGMGFGNMFGNMDKMMNDMNRAFVCFLCCFIFFIFFVNTFRCFEIN